jgi:hypothetical protein
MRTRPVILLFAIAVTLASGLTACGGGGDGGSPPKVAPAISNLTYSPTAVYVNSGGGTGTVVGTFSYTDTNGGLASVTLAVTDTSGATVTKTTTAVPPGAPPASGTLQGSVTFSTTLAGNYTIRVSVTDVAGLVSNELTGGFRIAPLAWVAKAAVPSPRTTGFVAAASGGRVYVIGGVMGPPEIVQIYDAATDIWTTGPTMPNAHGSWAVAVAVNEIVYVMGGFDAGTQAALATVDALDTATGIWSTKKPMPTPRYGAAAAAGNNRICVVGGYNGGTIQGAPALSSMDCYDPVADSWSAGPAMPTGRMSLGFDGVGGSAYAVGGVCCFGPGFPPLATVERYNATANTWSAVAALPTSRSFPAVVGASGLLFAIGGSGGATSALVPTVEAYDPSLAAWRVKTPMPSTGVPRAVQIGGVIYVMDQEGHNWQYTPANDIL